MVQQRTAEGAISHRIEMHQSQPHIMRQTIIRLLLLYLPR